MTTINGRTLEEIKRGLECCPLCNKSCPYYKEKDCYEKLHYDALAYNQQLEARIDTLTAKAVLFDEAVAAGEKMKRERDAAVADMRDATLCGCHVCKHYYCPDANVRIYACRKFGEFGKFDYIKDDGSMFCGAFEWRGVEVEQ